MGTSVAKKAPSKLGRPSNYSDKIAEKICMLLADGNSLRSICRTPGMPKRTTVWQWLEKHPEFAARYARAREWQAEAFVDDIADISDDARNDWMQRHGKDSVGYELNGEHIQRSKLRVDSRKWAASKILPKRYGDRTQHEHSGSLTLEALVNASRRPDLELEAEKSE